MKRILLVLIAALIITDLFGQTDKNGNPIFNNELISEEKFEDFELTSSYYTINNNIANKETSVFVNEKPTVKEYLKFARDLPSYFFIIHKGQNVFAMIILIQKNEGEKTTLFYNIVNPNNKKSIELPCGVWGDISEKRANELLQLKIDSTSKVIDLPNNGNGLLYEGIAYRIQPFNKLKNEVIEIAKQITQKEEKIDNIEEYIKTETIRGKLDFNKILEEEKTPMMLYDGVLYNKKDFAILLWAKKVKIIGVSSLKKAMKLWEEIYKRDLTDPEKKALTKGYNIKNE